MPRAKHGVVTRRTHKKTLKRAKGYSGRHRISPKLAHQTLLTAGVYRYRDRRTLKRERRNLWVIRINAAARQAGLSYSRLVAGLKAAGVALDRKVIADLAVRDSAAFAKLVELAKAA
ncbi:MAG: 50S ribosomal protein L20 [Deinococcus sp.]|nr:50S ribosomal protein L20 [Deinococcus sp.]